MLKFTHKKGRWLGKAQSGFYVDFFLKKLAEVFIAKFRFKISFTIFFAGKQGWYAEFLIKLLRKIAARLNLMTHLIL